jgi:hypothetical protein
MNERQPSRPIRSAAIAVAAATACALATTMLGCSVATIGLGSVGLGVGALVTYLLLAAGGGTACSPRGPVGVCLSVAPAPEDAGGSAPDVVEPPGPCLQPYAGVCLQPYAGPCLEYAPVEPCLEYVPQDQTPCLSEPLAPCLSMPAPRPDAGDPGAMVCLEAPLDESATPPSVHICLSDDIIEGELVVPGGKPAPPAPQASAAPARRLAAAGVLTEDQLRRLARLRGER